MTRRIWLASVLLFVSACGSKSSSPTSPSTSTPAAAQTRIIALSGTMDFGNIQVGQSFTATLNIRNSGNAPLTISGMTGPSNYTSTFTSGTIAAGASQAATIRFAPTFAQTYNGTLTVNGDQTSGTNTIAVSGTGSLGGLPLFSKSGSGDTVFDLPKYGVLRVKVIGTYPQNSSNFIVKVDGRLLVNELLGTGWGATRYEGTLLTGVTSSSAGTIAITNSNGVSWSFEEVR